MAYRQTGPSSWQVLGARSLAELSRKIRRKERGHDPGGPPEAQK